MGALHAEHDLDVSARKLIKPVALPIAEMSKAAGPDGLDLTVKLTTFFDVGLKVRSIGRYHQSSTRPNKPGSEVEGPQSRTQQPGPMNVLTGPFRKACTLCKTLT